MTISIALIVIVNETLVTCQQNAKKFMQIRKFEENSWLTATFHDSNKCFVKKLIFNWNAMHLATQLIYNAISGKCFQQKFMYVVAISANVTDDPYECYNY